MFNIVKQESPASKCYVSHGSLPHYIDPKQPPSKKKPFSTILNQPFTHTVELILPEEVYDLVWKDVEQKISSDEYFRVILRLSDILDGDFFNSYIKKGNILMLSEGRPGIDDLFFLKEGVLCLELAKESYERSGLVGKPMRDGGRKHLKTRYLVEINLRLPSMIHGKKGFERIVWAFKNVLNNAVTWLFYDFEARGSTQPSTQPIAKHHPIRKTISPKISHLGGIRLPELTNMSLTNANGEFEDWAVEIHEWLSLIALQSPRLRSDDHIDPYLCRYSVPESESSLISSVVILQWTGFIPASWIRCLLVNLSGSYLHLRKSRDTPFFALSAYAFHTQVVDGHNGYTVMRLPAAKVEESLDSASTKTEGHVVAEQPVAKHHASVKYVLWELAHVIDGWT